MRVAVFYSLDGTNTHTQTHTQRTHTHTHTIQVSLLFYSCTPKTRPYIYMVWDTREGEFCYIYIYIYICGCPGCLEQQASHLEQQLLLGTEPSTEGGAGGEGGGETVTKGRRYLYVCI